MPSLKHLWFSLTIIGLLISQIAVTSAQSTSLSPIYGVMQSDSSYTLWQFDLNGEQRQIFSLPKVTSVSYADFAPSSEIGFARQELNLRGFQADYVEDFMQAPLDASISQFTVSPDGQSIALVILYKRCSSFQNYFCSGVSQISVISLSTREEKTLFTLGLNSTQYFSGSVREIDVAVSNMQWTSDQQGLVIELTSDRTNQGLVNHPLVIISFAATAPLQIGEAQAWVVGPDSRTIAMLQIKNDLSYVLSIVSFDPATGQSSQESYSLGTYFPDITAGMAYTHDAVLFSSAWDTSRPENNPGGAGIAQFYPSQPGPITVAENLFNSPIGYIRSTPDGSVTLIETLDHKLWSVNVNQGSIQATSLLETPVSSWSLNADGTVLTQLQGSTDYQIIDQHGNWVAQFDPTARVPESMGQLIGLGS